MNWKNLKQNPPQFDEIIICIKDPKNDNELRKYRLATYCQPDPDEPEKGAFLINTTR